MAKNISTKLTQSGSSDLAPVSVPASKRERGFRKVLHSLDMTLFTVCAILIVDQLAASAAIGMQSIFWWLLTLVLFFIPYGLITAELGSSYPQEGGIYAWVRRAFGPLWAGRTAWLWWVNVAFWMPSVYILFSGVLSDLFRLDLSMWSKIGIALLLTWLTVGVNVLTLEVSKWIPNVGAVCKVTIMLAIGIGGAVYALRFGRANEFNMHSLTPSWNASLAFLPVIVYNYLGFELMSGASEEMENPARDVPLAIVRSGLIIAFFYIFATVGILLALPVADISVLGGLVDTFRRIFGSGSLGNALVICLGLLALFSFVANMVTWTLSANRSAAEAARLGDLPAFFGRLHRQFKTPMSSAILCGLIASIVVLVYGVIAKTAEDLFWTIFAFSSVVFLLPYLLLFLAFLKLRWAQDHRSGSKQHARKTRGGYRVPGNFAIALVISVICMLFIVQAIVFFVFKPGAFNAQYATSVIVGVLSTLLVGEVLLRFAKKNQDTRAQEVHRVHAEHGDHHA
jgi:glutamate:GABA antiporter